VCSSDLLQVALGDKSAGKEIQPDCLAVLLECFNWIHDTRLLDLW